MKKFAYAAALLVGLVGSTTLAATASDVSKAIETAVAANDKAASVGGEWRDARMFIEEAKKAAQSGDHEKALKLTNQAKLQGELGYQQAIAEQKKTFPPAHLR